MLLAVVKDWLLYGSCGQQALGVSQWMMMDASRHVCFTTCDLIGNEVT
jgi:hypothetical protein